MPRELTYPANEKPMPEFLLFRHAQSIADAQKIVAAEAETLRDSGTCVLGAGIAVDVEGGRGRGRRATARHILVEAPFQGNVASFRASERAILFLRSKGLDAYWYDGVMD